MTKPKQVRKRKPKPLTTEERLAQVLPAGILISAGNGKVQIDIDPTMTPDNFRALGGSDLVAANVALVGKVISLLPVSSDLWIMGNAGGWCFRAAGVHGAKRRCRGYALRSGDRASHDGA